MFGFETSSALFIAAWSLATVGVGLASGFFIGRTYTLAHEPRRLQKDRERTLKALSGLLDSTDQLNTDVDTHNNVLVTAKRDLEDVSVTEPNEIQSELLTHISRVVEANRKLESDLTQSRFQLESQAQELDRSRKEARTDPLCKIGNRKAFNDHINYRASRFNSVGEKFGLMIIDVDHFKRINDTFGHAAGDKVLVSIGSALKQCVRPQDFVARLGGDEFAIILDGLDEQNAADVGNRIRSTIELYNFQVGDEQGSTTVVTLSMGLATALPGDNKSSLFERADQALYKSKELGRNRLYTMYSTEEMVPT